MAYVLRITRAAGGAIDTLWVEALGEADRVAKEAIDAGRPRVDMYEARLIKDDAQIRREIAAGGTGQGTP